MGLSLTQLYNLFFNITNFFFTIAIWMSSTVQCWKQNHNFHKWAFRRVCNIQASALKALHITMVRKCLTMFGIQKSISLQSRDGSSYEGQILEMKKPLQRIICLSKLPLCVQGTHGAVHTLQPPQSATGCLQGNWSAFPGATKHHFWTLKLTGSVA